MTITLQAVNELIASLESAGELSIRETKVMALAKAYQQLAAENVGLISKRDERIAELESRTVQLPTTRLWAGVTECYEKSDVITAIRAAGVEVSDD